MTRQYRMHGDDSRAASISQCQLHEAQAVFPAETVSVFIGKRSECAFAWMEVPIDILVNAGRNAPILLVAKPTSVSDIHPRSRRDSAGCAAQEDRAGHSSN